MKKFIYKKKEIADNVNKYLGYNIQHDDHSYHCCIIYMKVVKRINRKNSHHKEKLFLFLAFSFYCICMR